jgi:phosphatidylserine/phosphatidylglycerophosphate/cardiolipin synthase-like enzyme/uncharacterized membrane protein YdjX (TVP38/TMEM64 family)
VTASTFARAGDNCWRILPSRRAALLIDGAAYFSALRHAIESARHSVVVLGWDIRADLVLDPEMGDEPLGALLDRVARQNPALELRILIWDWSLLFGLDRQPLPWWHLGVRTDERVHFALDSRHPPAGCHHEKVAVVDGRLAFVGGIDLTAGRWDTPAHLPVQPRRAPAGVAPRPPCHDYMLMVEGSVAGAVEELALRRWELATGEAAACTRAPDSEPSLWPEGVEPGFGPVDVAIARTRPAWRGEPAAREIERLYLAAIGRARISIYVENQYLTAEPIARALAARLVEPDGPEVVIVTPKACEGVFETAVMDVGRSRYLRRLRRAAASPDRVRIMTVEVSDGETKARVNVHGKLIIVDDGLLCVGSANLANRSMGLDTECNLAIEASDAPTRAAVRLVLARLLAEHLERDPADVLHRLEQAGGRIVPVIETCGYGRLRPLRLQLSPLVRDLASAARLIDLDEPLTSQHVATHLARAPLRRRLGELSLRTGLAVALMLAIGFLLAAGLLVGPEWLEWAFTLADRHAASPLGAAVVVLTFMLGSQLLVPITLMIALSAAVLGPVLGFVYALVGSCAAAAVTFLLGRLLGRRRVRRLVGRRVATISTRLGQHGVIAMGLLRLVPVAPFTLVNLMAGVSGIGLRDFVLGSAIGLLPGLVLMSLFGDLLGRWLRQPSPWELAALVGGLSLLLVLTRLLQRWSARPATA